jgi:hypothetical protein
VKNWKTTAAGILSFVLATTGPLTAYFALIHSPTSWQAQVPGALTLIAGLCRSWVGIISKDAGTEQVLLPGDSQPQTVPSHEVPDNPSAQVITKN